VTDAGNCQIIKDSACNRDHPLRDFKGRCRSLLQRCLSSRVYHSRRV